MFRKIKKNLLTKNRIKKYITYAIGEIVLVVIGILIALQINNWNEQAKNNQIKTVFLKDFISDLETDIHVLKGRITDNKNRLKAIDSILFNLTNKTKLSNKKLNQFINNHYELATESYFIAEQSTIRQFETSNNGNLILPKKIKDKLFKYYAMNNRIEQNDEKSLQLYQHNFITKDIITPFLKINAPEMVNFNFNTKSFELQTLKENENYLFAINIKKINTVNQTGNYKLIINTAENIIKSINTELSK